MKTPRIVLKKAFSRLTRRGLSFSEGANLKDVFNPLFVNGFPPALTKVFLFLGIDKDGMENVSACDQFRHYDREKKKREELSLLLEEAVVPHDCMYHHRYAPA